MTDGAERKDKTETADNRAGGQKQSRLWVLIPLVLFAGLSGIFFERLRSGENSADIPSPLLDKPVPEFSLPAVAGLKTANGADMPGFAAGDLVGTISLVNIWGSWCAPCRAEHPYLMELAKRDDIKMYGINYKDRPDNARQFLGALGNPYAAVGADEPGRTSIDWGVYGVPETFVINTRGCITYKHIGPLDQRLIAMKLAPAIEAAKTSTADCRVAGDEGKAAGS